MRGIDIINNSKLKINKEKIMVDVSENGSRYTRVMKNEFNIDKIMNEIEKISYMNYYHNLGGKWRRNEILEDKISFVPMAYAFYFYTVNKKCIPTIDNFCNFFLNSFCIKENGKYHFKTQYSNKPNFSFERQDLEAKICRAYGSYLREISLLHRFFDLQEKNKEFSNMKICYDVSEDVCGGSDIIIKNNKKTYGLLITQKSKNADKYNLMKRDHRHNYSYNDYIYVKLGEEKTEECGDVLLFTEEVAEKILRKIVENGIL